MRGVVALTCEDDLSDTVRPCLNTAADAAWVVDLTRVGEDPQTLAHVKAISITASDPKMVVSGAVCPDVADIQGLCEDGPSGPSRGGGELAV